MRAAIAENVRVGRGTWITPFTPIFSDVGSHEMWEGAPARRSGRCTELRRTANTCRYTRPIWLLETANVLMQIFIFFWLNLLPGSVILWLGRSLIPAGEAELADAYFKVAPLTEIAWQLTLYAFITTWAAACRGLSAELPLHPLDGGFAGVVSVARAPGRSPPLPIEQNERHPGTVDLDHHRAVPAALAGMRFPRVGASECDVMFNLVPEVASADSQVFWSNGCFTNMLDYGAEHIKLRRLDMPRNFFTGNNCVAEYGNFPANFLLGVSTPASDIDFRRQMRSRPGEPITVAGNPPVKFASAAFEAGERKPTGCPASGSS
jgi:hypothetical protein